jgi:hypothetical protein
MKHITSAVFGGIATAFYGGKVKLRLLTQAGVAGIASVVLVAGVAGIAYNY